MNKTILIFTIIFTTYLCNAYAKEILISNFDSIEIDAGKHTNYVIDIEQNDRLPSAIVEEESAEKNIYKLNYNTLIIKLQKHAEKNYFKIRVHDLKKLSAYGKGSIRGRNLDVSCLVLALNDKVQAKFSGSYIGLTRLEMTGSSQLYLDHLKTEQLKLVLKDVTQATLLGEANANEINLYGASRLKLYWLHATDLFVRMHDRSFAYLAGTARILETRLKDSSYLFARYLRVKQAYIKSNQSSNVEIWAQKTLYTRADGRSTIFHYRPADQVETYEFKNGAVLGMNHLKPLLRDPSLDWGQEYENSPRFVY